MKVSWDCDIPNMMGNIKFIFQTTNQHDIEGIQNSRQHKKLRLGLSGLPKANADKICFIIKNQKISALPNRSGKSV